MKPLSGGQPESAIQIQRCGLNDCSCEGSTTLKKARYDRAAVAREVIATLVPLVRTGLGRHDGATTKLPEHFAWNTGELRIMHTPSVIVDAVLGRPQHLLDIWWGTEGKVFSALWEPMEIVRFKGGPWIDCIFNLSARRSLQ